MQSMRQWLGETDASSMQIELEELRPIDRIPPTWNSDFLSGPLNAASLGCTARLLATSLLRRHTGLMGRQYSSANAGCLPSQGLYPTRTLSERIVRLSNWFVSGSAVPLDSQHIRGSAISAFFSSTYRISWRKCRRVAQKPSSKLVCSTDRPTTQSDSYSFLCPESTAAVFRTKLTPSLFKPTSSPLVGQMSPSRHASGTRVALFPNIAATCGTKNGGGP